MSQRRAEEPRPNDDEELPKPQFTPAQAKRIKTPLVSMLITMLVLAAGLGILWAMNPEPDTTFTRDENVPAAASYTADVADFSPVVPDVPEGWTANYARWEMVTPYEVNVWEVGYTTDGVQFFGLAQSDNATESWINFETDQAPVVGTETTDGMAFELREQGERRYYVLNAADNTVDGTTVVITTDTSAEEGEAGIDAVLAQLGAAPPEVDEAEVLDPSDIESMPSGTE